LVQEAIQKEYYYGTGKRKCAIAKVRLYLSAGPGESGQAARIQVNGKPMDEAFAWPPWQQTIQEPLAVTDSLDRFTVIAAVAGGGVSAQSQAIRHGIAKALAVYDETLKPALRRYGLLTRDSRIKESKKYGLKRARRAPQYTKR
jgi:small subunit ribosomal protein S9